MTMTSSTPYWWQEAPPTSLPIATVAAKCDVVIIGAGYTGLSAALTLARALAVEDLHLSTGPGQREGGAEARVAGADDHHIALGRYGGSGNRGRRGLLPPVGRG